MVSIETKFYGPTNTRGSRVLARVNDNDPDVRGKVTLDWNHALNCDENHDAAARALIHKLGWDTADYLRPGWVRGSTADGYVYVNGYAGQLRGCHRDNL